MIARQRFQATGQIHASLQDMAEETRLGDFFDDGAADGGGEGIAAERAALIAMLETTHVLMSDQRGKRHAAAEPFAQRHDIRLDPRVLEAEELSRSADARLNLIQDQKNARAPGQSAQAAQI